MIGIIFVIIGSIIYAILGLITAATISIYNSLKYRLTLIIVFLIWPIFVAILMVKDKKHGKH